MCLDIIHINIYIYTYINTYSLEYGVWNAIRGGQKGRETKIKRLRGNERELH
jgi:hypothetical protein